MVSDAWLLWLVKFRSKCANMKMCHHTSVNVPCGPSISFTFKLTISFGNGDVIDGVRYVLLTFLYLIDDLERVFSVDVDEHSGPAFPEVIVPAPGCVVLRCRHVDVEVTHARALVGGGVETVRET